MMEQRHRHHDAADVNEEGVTSPMNSGGWEVHSRSVDWESPALQQRAAKVSLILVAIAAMLGLASWLASRRPTVLAAPMTMSQWESYVHSGVPVPIASRSTAEAERQRARSAWKAYEESRGQALGLRKSQAIQINRMKVSGDQRLHTACQHAASAGLRGCMHVTRGVCVCRARKWRGGGGAWRGWRRR